MAELSSVGSNLNFLPWVRQGAAAGIAQPDTLGPVQPGSVAVTAAVSVNNTPAASLAVRLLGPADVLGLDVRQIVRMDPPPGSSGFEPNNFVAVEFDRPDLPWLFTPAAASADGKLRPWLCLVVVKLQPGVVLRPAGGDAPLPVLDISAPAIPGEELPDLAESWLWAHAQVTAGDPASVLAGPSDLSLSRLWCPRLLAPDTDYLAALVPAFALGVMAGLGQSIADSKLTRLDPAWPTPASRVPASVSLPLYHHWTFRSGAGGDFKSLVQLLKVRPVPAGLGRRPIDIGQPGFPVPAVEPPVEVGLGGALQALDAPDAPEPWPDGVQLPLRSQLADIVNAPGLAEEVDPQADPLLAPPLYGRWHAARPTARLGVPPIGNWFDELNLDPRHRAVAAFGTRVVQEHQEALMEAAWAQAGEVQQGNQQLRQLQLGLFVGDSLHARHFATLSPDALMRISGPALARVKLSAAATGLRGAASPTLAAQLGGSTLPPRAASAAMRRMTRPLGPINRRFAARGVPRPTTLTMLSRLGSGAAQAYVVTVLSDAVTLNGARLHMEHPEKVATYQQVTSGFVAIAVVRPLFTILPDGQSPTTVPAPVVDATQDNPVAAAFRKAAVEHLALVKPTHVEATPEPRPTLALDGALRTALLAQLAPRRTLLAYARARVPALRAAARDADAPPLEPMTLIPSFPQPMYEPLRDVSQELLLPGLEAVLPNSVIGLKTNRRFVEAYLVGLNHEMGRELLWRGFPTDQRGTYFDCFWDNRGAPQPRPDIAALHLWGARLLGDAANAPARERFVMLMRSELLRRYPGATVYAVPARRDANGVRGPSQNAGDELAPAFRGSMQPDVTFFGFDLDKADAVGEPGWYVVIQEQPTEPRLGLEADTPRPARSHLRIADGAPAGLDLKGLTWGGSAAQMAGILRQVPVRIAIHASRFLP